MICSVRNSILKYSTAVAPKSNINRLLAIGIPVAVASSLYFYSTTIKPLEADALNPDEWRPFVLKEIIPINHNTKQFRFALPSGTTTLGLPTASACVTKFQDGVKEDGSPIHVIRPYTPIEDPADGFTGIFDLVVKAYPGGKMSSHIHSLKVGETLEMKGPIKKWEYKANEFASIGMIAGGTGITPMLQVIQRIVADPKDKTKVSLLFGNVTHDDILLKDTLDKIVAKRPGQIHVHYALGNTPVGWTGLSGHVNKDMVKDLMPAPGNGLIFICGPPPMVEHVCGSKAKDYSQGDIGGLMKQMGYSSSDIYKF